jgi:hypothetical protein
MAEVSRLLPFPEENDMQHELHLVRSFTILAPYTLRVGFEDGVERTIDFEPVLAGELYEPLRDLSLFNQVAIDSEVHTLVWPNGADFDPETLYNWDTYVDALADRARGWRSKAA